MKRIWQLMMLAAGRYRAQYVSSVRISLLASLVQAGAYASLIPLLAALAAQPVRHGEAWLWLGVFVVCYLIEAVLRSRELGFQHGQWAEVLADVRLRLGRKLRTMRQRDLEERASGDLTSLVGGTVVNATSGISTAGLLFLQFVTVPVVLLVVILLVDWRLGVVLAISTPFAIGFVRRIQSRGGTGMRRLEAADADASARVVEYVQGLPVLKAAGQVGAASDRLRRALTTQGTVMSQAQKGLMWPGLLASSAVQIGIVAMVALGAGLALDADLSVPVLLAVVAGAVRFAEPLATASQMTVVFEMTDAALARVGEVLEAEPLPVAEPAAKISAFDISFDDVSFGYGTKPVVRELTFSVPERSLTALVGPSGSGKTTITRLLTRYADPDGGRIRIGGSDLRQVEPAEIFRHVSVVFQDVYLFDDTIRENIAMARPNATDAEIEAAARAANVVDFIDRLPRGYDTRVGEIGGALSGGERQRISIARAILKDAPIVLLDEPTAALDTESEVAVQEAIDALVTDKTVIVIAHRLTTVVGADQILVLDEGRITERGTHTELLTAGGRYAGMWNAQTDARHWRLAPHS
ncbi:ABC transporter ATP-binding protein [Amycolatopsis sp. EV170708-02-1]|uniref:ABC transporter ATP-binding protein n=1 Tax=Amycolatopsis sp. EV170708-02-1 TaxID=2919322 RepID=UPI001F0BE8A2|nr:ABC transporter ATP-binding protein [Amycolatopsis sp. EV170708-02-1]UMP01310.1 ABC transporter ATP-binding protein/permease [Amycolatopsis sp. EV170708-02-1]